MKPKKFDEKNLGESFIESVGASSLTEIAGEAADIAFDIVLEDGLLKEIPIFGWLLKSYGAYQSISDRMFLKKVALFLMGVSQAPTEEREKFTHDLKNNSEMRKKVGENVLLLIDKHERLEKSYLLGLIMAKVIENKCTKETFLRIAAALDRSIMEDLEFLKKQSKNISDLPDNVKQGLYKSGFLDQKIEAYAVAEPIVTVRITYNLNELGEKLIEYAFSEKS